jgi:hypothetical protein
MHSFVPWVGAAVLSLLVVMTMVAVWRRIVGLEAKFAIMASQVTPLSAAFRSVLIRELTHNHTPEMDALLARLENGPFLSQEEEERLYVLLRERVIEFDDPLITDRERDSAAMLPMVMKRVRGEDASGVVM